MQTPVSPSIRTIYEDDHFLVVDKPAGIPTHSPDNKILGMVEILSRQLGVKLGVHQRLDAETSGVLAFSKTPQGAQRLGKAFELRNVQKTYRALVCGIPAQTAGQWAHYLLYDHGRTIQSDKGKLAKTRYRVLTTIGPFALLELDLLTGITHQLRAQCAIEGFPILGDSLYGGGDLYPRLCLHAKRLRITSEPNLPAFYAELPSILDKPYAEKIFAPILMAKHQQSGEIPKDEAIRLLTPPHSGIPELIVEKMASVLLIRHLEPDDSTLWNESALRLFANQAKREFECDSLCYRVHESPSKGHCCRKLAKSLDTVPEPLKARENGVLYQFDFTGNAVGLYLDQRENRAWIARHAHGSVLNLFAYTCAFSVCAALNPAVLSTASVDSSKAALARGRSNFECNHVDLDGHRFIAEDSIKYLKKCVQNHIQFDTVICDPPSFGRAGKIVFSLEDDLEELMRLCAQVSAPGATWLFSINHRKIRLNRLYQSFERAWNGKCPKHEIFVNDDTVSVLGVGTDLKTIRCAGV